MQKILVVDDAEINRELLREFLEVDYIVETAGRRWRCCVRSIVRFQRCYWICICRIQTALQSLSRCENRGGWRVFRC